MTVTRRALLAALPLAALPRPARSAGNVRLVVPFPAGGAVDQLGRLLAERLGPILDAQVIVENVGGLGGMAGMNAVAKGTPDGSILGIAPVATLVTNRYLYGRMPYDPQRDLTPLTRVVTGTVLCVVNAERARERGWNRFEDLIAWAKANPGKVLMGSSGAGQTSHLVLELVNRRTDAGIVHVPYRGGAQAITDLLGGRIDMMFDVMPALMPHVQAGTFRPLAVASAEPSPLLPGTPGMKSFGALGLGEVDLQSWLSVVAPAGLPEEKARSLHDAVVRAAQDPGLKSRIEPGGYTVVTDPSPQAFRAFIETEHPVWESIVKISGAKLE